MPTNIVLTFGKRFYNGKTSLPCQRIVSRNKAKVAKITDDPCLNLRSFSQPQIFKQQFCFHEIRLTDYML